MINDVRPLTDEDIAWVRGLFIERWGGTTSVSRGVAHETTGLPGFVARLDGDRVGVATYRLDGGACELVTLDSTHRGAGTALVHAVRRAAETAGAVRLWLVTTNDNLHALRFYQRYGFDLVAVHRDAVARSRELKPSIPETGDGIPIRHELELELPL